MSLGNDFETTLLAARTGAEWAWRLLYKEESDDDSDDSSSSGSGSDSDSESTSGGDPETVSEDSSDVENDIDSALVESSAQVDD